MIKAEIIEFVLHKCKCWLDEETTIKLAAGIEKVLDEIPVVKGDKV